MATDLDELLLSFDESAYSVRLVKGICNVVPFAQPITPWNSLVAGLTVLDENAKKPVLDAAHKIAKDEDMQQALWAITALDSADSGIGVFSGAASAWKMYQAKDTEERINALETDTQQAVDAVVKALAIAYVIHKLYDGDISDKIAQFRKSESGQAMMFYYAAIEVGLPFTDNALSGGASFLKTLFDKYGPEQQTKLAAITGEEEAAAAMGVLQQLTGPLATMVDMASQYLTPIATAVTEYLPKAMSVGDKAAGVAATGADLLPVYRFLGGRLVAEEVLKRALVQKAEEVATSNPASTEIKFTRSKDDLPDAPIAKRGGCFGFFIALFAVGFSSVSAAGWWM